MKSAWSLSPRSLALIALCNQSRNSKTERPSTVASLPNSWTGRSLGKYTQDLLVLLLRAVIFSLLLRRSSFMWSSSGQGGLVTGPQLHLQKSLITVDPLQHQMQGWNSVRFSQYDNCLRKYHSFAVQGIYCKTVCIHYIQYVIIIIVVVVLNQLQEPLNE